MLRSLDRAVVYLLVGAIRGYQLTLSPLIGNQCRHHPTCSHYGIEALKRHGALRGLWLTTTRLLRCHPFARGGFDPVPDSIPAQTTR
ncbi:MAG: membrane protein insertion efficiency factor YidD [Pseudomonadota bacterium]